MSDSTLLVDRSPEPCNDFVGGISTRSERCPRCHWPIHEHPPEPWVVQWLEERRTQPITRLQTLPVHLRGEPV